MKGDAIAVPGFLDDAATAERPQFGGDLCADVAAHVASANNWRQSTELAIVIV